MFQKSFFHNIAIATVTVLFAMTAEAVAINELDHMPLLKSSDFAAVSGATTLAAQTPELITTLYTQGSSSVRQTPMASRRASGVPQLYYLRVDSNPISGGAKVFGISDRDGESLLGGQEGPEPSSIVMLATLLPLAGTWGIRRRRRNRSAKETRYTLHGLVCPLSIGMVKSDNSNRSQYNKP